MTQPGIPNEYVFSTTCFGPRLRTIEDQAFSAVAMGFRRLELGLSHECLSFLQFTGRGVIAILLLLGPVIGNVFSNIVVSL